MIESAEIMVIGIEIGIAGTEVARRGTLGIHAVEGTEIGNGRELEEIQETREIRGEVEEVEMIGMADVIEAEIGREMAIGMEQETGESEVSTLMIGLCGLSGQI